MTIDLTDEERDFLLHVALDGELLGLTDSKEDDGDRQLARTIRAKLAAPATSPAQQSSAEKKDSSAT